MLFRITYTQKIIDVFTTETKDQGPSAQPSQCRSRVLNLILQQQLNGYNDHKAPMLEAHFTNLGTNDLQQELVKFYLSCNSLDPVLQPDLWQGILYVTKAKLFLGIEAEGCWTPNNTCHTNTGKLLASLKHTKESEEQGLNSSKIWILVVEVLEL